MAIVACGLVAVVAQLVLPLVTAPVRRTASWFALAGAVGNEPPLVLVALIMLAAVGVVVVGGWMLVGGPGISARRRGGDRAAGVVTATPDQDHSGGRAGR